jgi:hypothetical protein
MVGCAGEGVVNDVKLQTQSFAMRHNILHAVSVIEVECEHLATLEESLDTSWSLPLGALIEHERAPGLATSDRPCQRLGSHAVDLGAETGSNDPDFGPGVTKLIHLVLVLEFDGGFVVPLLVVE